MIAYEDIIRDGDRPMYAVEMIPHIVRDREQYAELRRPLQSAFFKDALLSTQYLKWHTFKAAQRDERGLIDDTELSFDRWAEKEDREQNNMLSKRGYEKWKQKAESKPHKLRQDWQCYRQCEDTLRNKTRDSRKRFHGHVKSVKATLAEHGMEPPVHFLDDPKQQDVLTTWMEYLAFEYWVQNEKAQKRDENERELEEAWDAIVASEYWTPSQMTREYIDAFNTQPIDAEVQGTQDAWFSACRDLREFESRVANEDGLSGVSQEAIDARLQHLRHSCEERRQHHETVSRPWDVLADYQRHTTELRCAKEEGDAQSLYVRWVEDQIPIIKSEIAAAAEPAVEHGPEETGSNEGPQEEAVQEESHGESRKRDSGEEDGGEEEHSSKRSKPLSLATEGSGSGGRQSDLAAQ